MKLSKELKSIIFKELLSQPAPFNDKDKEDSIMDFLESIWDLKIMPSEDDRFVDAYGDIYQHVINNNDWNYSYLFIDRLNILEDDLKFEKFLNAIISPLLRKNEDDIMNYYYLIEPYLTKEGLSYSLIDYTASGLPIYELREINTQGSSKVGLKTNEIPFFTIFNPKGRASHFESYDDPKVFPSFVLVLNDGWNDFGVISEFHLYYHPQEAIEFWIGKVKIMHKKTKMISDILDEDFKTLSEDFCSLGQHMNYYENLKEHLGVDFESVLWSLKDTAFYPEIHEKYENNENFRDSLIRQDEPERLLREARYRLYGYDLSNVYSFKYHFKPKFADNNLDVEFNFKNDKNSFNRIHAIIGKNGTGKTQLITSLPIDISKKNNSLFTPMTPLFSKVIAVSYSVFDSFEIPKNTASFNYQYCGLNDEKGTPKSERGLRLRFHNTRKRIEEIGRTEKWVKILKNFIDDESIDRFITRTGSDIDFLPTYKYTFNLDEFGKVIKQLSSGQSIILYIITEIVAHIRLDSIILYDEPETHLHPNAITQLINTIYELVHEFQSYCIIATHSPLIIRELLSKNVYVIEREANFSSIKRIGLESFGENLSILTEEVFGNRGIPKQYKLILERLVEQGKNYLEIKELLEFDEIPLSINASVYLKSILNEKS